MKNPVVIVLVILVLAGGVWFASTKNFFRQEVKPLKIGILYKGKNFQKVADGFVDGFKEGLAVDKKVEFILKDEQGTEQKDFDAAAQGLIDSKVDLIVAIGVEPVVASKKVTAVNKIPVILELGVNPATQGFVADFQKPGGNLTGISWQVEELTGKRLEILTQIDPRIKRITIFRKKGTSVMTASLSHLEPIAKQLGVTVTVKEVSTVEELQAAVTQVTRANADAIFYASDPFVQRNGEFIIKHALKEKLPVMFHDEYFTRLGSIASYGANFPDSGRQGARLAKKILFDHQLPSDIPVETAPKIDFALNVVTAKAIGVPLSPDILSLAQIVIE